MNVRNAVTPLTIGIISALIGLFILTGANAETGEPEQTSGHWPASQPIGGELGPVTDAMLKQSPSNNLPKQSRPAAWVDITIKKNLLT